MISEYHINLLLGKLGTVIENQNKIIELLSGGRELKVFNAPQETLDIHLPDPLQKEGAVRVMLKPATEGTGVKAGGPVRDVLELAGVKDVLSKSLGSSTKVNMARATLNALKLQKSPAHVAELRGKTVEEILG